MIRKLMVVLLSGAICLFSAVPLLAETTWQWSTLQEYEEATGNKIEKFSEAPMLRLKVAAGELPPIEQRLPEEPLVDKPFEEVGTYGGTLRLGMLNMGFWAEASVYTMEYMLSLNRKAEKVVPNIAKGWEFSDEGKTLTLYLRKGMKWSDGAPFTADDILFYWEAVILNDEIAPVKPKEFMPGGKLMIVEKVDDYTVSFHFSKPYWSIVWYLSGTLIKGCQNYIFLPKHALEKYHIDYNTEADELAKENNYDHWWELFNVKRYFHGLRQPNPDIPSLGPWVTKQILTEGVVYERNPYYYKIDTAGNQLPYIDTIKATIFTTKETLILRMVAGEYDYESWITSPADYPVLMGGAEKGGYYVWLAKNLRGSEVGYLINQNYNEDSAIGDILRDVRFRRAFSLAINREEINEILFYGKGVGRQATIHPSCSFYKEEWGSTYTEYDTEKANQLLDEMGLNKRDKQGYRFRSDGKPLSLVILTILTPGASTEIVKEYLEEVGIKVSIHPVDPTYMHTCFAGGTYMIALWGYSESSEPSIVAGMNASVKGRLWAPQWMTWLNTNGEKGEEPPDEVKRMASLYDDVPFLPEEERNKVLTEVFDIWAEGLWHIGVIGLPPFPAITNINLGNVNTDTYSVDNPDVGCGNFNRIYQFFWKK